MSWRRLRRLVLIALVIGAGLWYFRERPTLSKIVDGLTRPLFGSKAAVHESERKRVLGDAVTVVTLQTEDHVGMLREKMTRDEVRGLLGAPDVVEAVPDYPERVRWIYRVARRSILFENGRVVSIAVL